RPDSAARRVTKLIGTLPLTRSRSARSSRPSEPKLPGRPAGEGLRESCNAPMIRSFDERLVHAARIIGRDSSQRDLRLDPALRSPNNEASYDCILRRASWPRPAGARGEIDPV